MGDEKYRGADYDSAELYVVIDVAFVANDGVKAVPSVIETGEFYISMGMDMFTSILCSLLDYKEGSIDAGGRELAAIGRG